jgi:hypothetical protein
MDVDLALVGFIVAALVGLVSPVAISPALLTTGGQTRPPSRMRGAFPLSALSSRPVAGCRTVPCLRQTQHAERAICRPAQLSSCPQC